MTNAEDLIIEGNKMDAQTKEEVISFVAENTFIDGQSLSEVFPRVEEFLTSIEQNAQTLEERFNLDGIRITPRNLNKTENFINQLPHGVREEIYDVQQSVEELKHGIQEKVGSEGRRG